MVHGRAYAAQLGVWIDLGCVVVRWGVYKSRSGGLASAVTTTPPSPIQGNQSRS